MGLGTDVDEVDKVWQVWNWPDALAVEREFAVTPFWREPRAVTCPIDQTVTVRSYYQVLSDAKSAVYRWCPLCRRYNGQTISSPPPPPTFAETVMEDQNTSLPSFLDELEKQWVAGVIPQQFNM